MASIQKHNDRFIVALIFLLAISSTSLHVQAAEQSTIPVILDTDIGGDIDDTWALALLLKCPELDVRLVVGDHGMSHYRAKLIAKILEQAGRSDIPVGVGIGSVEGTGGQQAWVTDYELDDYPGPMMRDGVQAIIDTIMNSPEQVTLIAIGPAENLEEALRREPRIAERSRFVGMYGSLRKGYGGRNEPNREVNVAAAPAAFRAVLAAPWEVTITPLDTCGLVYVRGERYQKIRQSSDPVAQMLLENYTLWADYSERHYDHPNRADVTSTTLFDTVAIYMAFANELCQTETLPVAVTDNGMTIIREGANRVTAATAWNDLPAFEDFLVERLISSLPETND